MNRATPITATAKRDRIAEYERWLSSSSLRAIAMRWLLGEQGAFLLNTPVLRLPTELRLDGSERVLDIGCGRGALLRQLDRQLRFARDPVGLDCSRAVLRLA
ncbi:MAG: class I SAM-dependent methyltransferase, partial [Chloroflexi bacterium]|nr:class I SAM-dependent methyltransferase [Chloroflexota bacterium]